MQERTAAKGALSVQRKALTSTLSHGNKQQHSGKESIKKTKRRELLK